MKLIEFFLHYTKEKIEKLTVTYK